MKLLSSFSTVAFALVLVGAVGLCVAEENVTLLLVAGVLAVLSRSMTEGPRRHFLPIWLAVVAAVVVLLNGLLDLQVRQIGWQRSLGHLTLWLTIVRLYQPRQTRGHALLMLLSLALILLGAVQSTSLLFGVVLITYAAIGVYALMLHQLHAGHERHRARRRRETPHGLHVVPSARPVAGRHSAAQLRLLGAGTALAGLALGLLVFVLFPRELGRGVLPVLRAVAGGRAAGPPETVDLGSNLDLTASRRLVMTVTARGGADPSAAVRRPLRLRAGTLNIYQRDRRWRSTPSQMRSVPTIPSRWTPLGEVDADSDDRLTLLVEPARRVGVIFTMSVPFAVRTAQPEALAFNPITYRALRDGRRLEPYEVAVDPAPSDEQLRRLAGSLPPATDRTVMLDGLRSPAIAELSRSILAQAGLWPPPPRGAQGVAAWRATAAAALSRHLHEGPYRYTLAVRDIDPPGADTADPIERFLFETGAGHCEHFASALAALCWNVGIPTRLVAGYLGYVPGPGESVRVLACNAHAWTEVQTSSRRWVELDPTPPAVRQRLHEIRPTLADRISWIYQRLEASWDDAIASYDRDAQGRIAARLDPARLAGLADTARDWLDRLNRAFYFGPAGTIWLGIVAFAALLAVLALARAVRRARRLRRSLGLQHVRGAERRHMLRRLAFYLDMLETLRAGGAAKPGWMPPEQFADELAGSRPRAAALVRRLTGMYYDARYGGRVLSPTDAAQADGMVRELSAALRQRG